MIKGGYKIVNFNGAALSGTAVELSGIYAQIVDDYDKPIMVSGVSLNGTIMDDAFAGVQEKTAQDLSKSVELTVYGGIITVTEDDEVTFVLSKTTAELTAEIGDLEDLETIDKGSVVEAVNEVNSYTTKTLVRERKSAQQTTIAAGEYTITIDISKEGYTPIGIVGLSLGRVSINISGFDISGNDGLIIGLNSGSSVTVSPYVIVLYRKN